MRFNLTFRRLKPQWAQRAPLCACGRPAQMKARQPRQLAAEGEAARELPYYYACESGGQLRLLLLSWCWSCAQGKAVPA